MPPQPGQSDQITVLQTLTQALKEFWFPLVIAILWTGFDWWSAPDGRGVAPAIAAFGGSFFLTSWMLSQWFRIKKQQRVDGSLKRIERDVTHSIQTLETETRNLLHTITGGKSYCYADVTGFMSHGVVALVHAGAHGLYEVSVAMVDQDEVEQGNGRQAMQQHGVGSLIPKSAKPTSLRTNDSTRVNFYFSARNGFWRQQVALHPTPNGTLLRAWRVRGDDLDVEHIDPGFPRKEDGKIAWW